ncbi:MAG TPA: hypothetical protein VNY29_03830 [Terriglobales bacterium]|jgi:hypothetical protein|nr:hypothetical protein [Terriglobales bacterium]
MTVAPRLVLLATVVAVFAQTGVAQKSKDVIVREPGVYELANLFKQADSVVLVKIAAGDTEAYDVAIYKAEVVRSFKGRQAGETIYFGPYVGEKLGWEYILFLRNVSNPITPKVTSSTGYGPIHYSEIFNEGYTSMETSYGCVFDGKDISQKCDYGVRICTDYIRLPKSIPTFPSKAQEPPFGCRWVRKAVFISLLDTLGNPRK